MQQLEDATSGRNRERKAVEKPAVLEVGSRFEKVGKNTERSANDGADETVQSSTSPINLDLFASLDFLVLIYQVPKPEHQCPKPATCCDVCSFVRHRSFHC